MVEHSRAAADRHPNLATVVADGLPFHEAGGSDGQELGAALAAGLHAVRVLNDAGLSVDDAFARVEIRLAATADQFATLAKLRAARRCWDRIGSVAGASAGARALREHAVTSPAMMTSRDPWVNILRDHGGHGRGRPRRGGRGHGAAVRHRARPARRLRPPHRPQHPGAAARGVAPRARHRPGRRVLVRRVAHRRARPRRLGRVHDDRARRRDRGRLSTTVRWPRRSRRPGPRARTGSRTAGTRSPASASTRTCTRRCRSRTPSPPSDEARGRPAAPPLRAGLRGAARPRGRRPSSGPGRSSPPSARSRSTPRGPRSRRTCCTPGGSTSSRARAARRSTTIVAAFRESGTTVAVVASSDKVYAEHAAPTSPPPSPRRGPRGYCSPGRRRPTGSVRDDGTALTGYLYTGCDAAGAAHRPAGRADRRGRLMGIGSFADVELGTPEKRGRPGRLGGGPRGRHRQGPRGPALGDARRASGSSRSTPRPTPRAWTSSRPSRACRRSCAGPTRRCTAPSPGRCASTPGSRRRRSRTPSTGATSPPGRRASRSPSTCRPTAGTTRTTRASPATSGWRACRSTRSSTCASSSTASRWTGCRCR